MKTILLATALAMLAPAVLLAGPDDNSPPPDHGPGSLRRWDTNGDGVISREEAQAAGAEHIAQRFDSLDVNKDGQLTQDELQQARQQHMAGMKEHFAAEFKAADKNGDGSLSKDEAQGMPMVSRHFDDIDTNKDGLITQEEIDAHHAKMGPHHRGDGEPPPPQN